MALSNRLCAQRIIWNEPETENWERQREKRHYAGDRLREEGARWTERHERCRGREGISVVEESERVFPNPINLGYFSNILQFFLSLRVRLVRWKESERKENYGNRWMNLDNKINQIYLLVCVIFLSLHRNKRG
jgi:hypothetical protein